MLKAGKEALQNAITQAITINVNAVDLSVCGFNEEPLRSGKRIRVISDPHGIDEYMLCTSVKYDLLRPEKTEYALGKSYETLTDEQNRVLLRSKSTAAMAGSLDARIENVGG